MTDKPTLWHGTPQPLTEDLLYPRATGQFREIAPVVFVSSERTQALMFAVLEWPQMNGPILSGVLGGVRYVVVPDRDYYMRYKSQGTLLKFPAQNSFDKHAKCGETEWVSFAPVSVANCEQHPVKGIEDLLDAGVQTLFFDPKKISRESITDQMVPTTAGSWVAPSLTLHNLIKMGLLTHENAIRNIRVFDYAAAARQELANSAFRLRTR